MKILSYQGTPTIADVDANLRTIQQTACAASTMKVDVLVFPELFVTGYNIGDQIKKFAQPREGQIVSRLAEIAKQNSIAIICGFPELDQGKIYNSSIAIDSTGSLVGHHRKVFLFGDEEKQIFTSGNSFSCFELNGVRCGMSICYDIEFPETTRDLAKQGARIVFNPTANMMPYMEVPYTLARARALENGIVIVYSNLCGEENGLSYTGLSAIIGPNGVDIARAGGSETILVSDICDELLKARASRHSTQLADLKGSPYYL